MIPFGLREANLKTIRDGLQRKKQLARGRQEALFSVFDEVKNEDERVALEFLYAFMPLVDLADYHGGLFLQHVRHSLEVRRTVPWGSKISGTMFLHYVLPYRISNETIEDYRPYFFEELYRRVKHLSMADAILEINHWCHEKATYIATDPRTASPLTLVRSGCGRCGEESALLVAALRSLCLPARQVYTPRWSHTDSNHAWVEAWADGKWYFLGACEPEPRLNRGWFAGPAKRAMLLHTKVYGTIYDGPEEQVQVGDGLIELNLLPNYAPVRKLRVAAKDGGGNPVPGAKLDFQVFNYGGFSTIACLSADHKGEASLTTGAGDLLVHASAGRAWGYAFAKADGQAEIEVVLDDSLPLATVEFRLNAPPELPAGEPDIDPAEKEENDRRLKKENQIRAAYEATFLSPAEAAELATELGIDQTRTVAVLKKARGNSRAIAVFLQKADPRYRIDALELLAVLAAKDLTDTNGSILNDHLEGSLQYKGRYGAQDFRAYVLQPRISLEVLRPFRKFFQGQFTAKEQAQFRADPALIRTWIGKNIAPVEDASVIGWPTPQGIYELQAGDLTARQILFVALARSFGIAARLSPVDGKAQYLMGGSWIDAGFTTTPGETPLGTILVRRPADAQDEQEYFHSFSLARLEDGAFHTLRFKGLDEEAFDDENFTSKLPARPGHYRLVAGNRLTDGSVAGYFTTFSVKRDETSVVDLRSFEEKEAVSTLGKLPEGIVLTKLVSSQAFKLDQALTEQGLILAWVEPEKEPTKHLIRDLFGQSERFDTTGSQLVFCLGEDNISESFSLENYAQLPSRSTFVLDSSYGVLQRIRDGLDQDIAYAFPIVLVVDQHRTVRYISTGYRIGTGTHILEHLENG